MRNIKIEKATPDDLGDISALIGDYSYKLYQQVIQGIDKNALNEFLTEGVKVSLENPAKSSWIVRRRDEPLAAAIVSPNEWHSRFYGLDMARCETFLSFRSPRETTPLLCKTLKEESKERGWDHLSLRIDGAEYENLHMLEEDGFRLIDCSLKLGAKIQPGFSDGPPDVSVRPYAPADRKRVIEIAKSEHPDNHFNNEPAFKPRATRELFGAWVERCLDGLAAHVFVVESESEGVLGFVTYLVSRALNEKMGLGLVILDYAVLAPEARGRGIGSAMMGQSLASLSAEFSQVELRTSHKNCAALSLYTKYGFRVLSSDFIFHRLYR